MRHILRLALPPLRELDAQREIAFALCDRTRRVLRVGALPLARLAAELPSARVEAILHPDDMVATQANVPPLRGARLQAAVIGAVEPMILGDVEALAIGHGPRHEDGHVDVAWIDRERFLQAWQRLSSASVPVSGWIPAAWLPAVPGAGALPELAADLRWSAAVPTWQLADSSVQAPAQNAARWRQAGAWTLAAAAVWVIGLNLYAGQREREATGLREDMRRQLLAAFPDTPVIVDPVRQAAQRRDALRASQGGLREDDFLPLALGAARAFDFTADKVLRVQYGASLLRLTPTAGTSLPSPARLAQQGTAFGLAATVNGSGISVRRADSAARATQGAAR